MIIESRYLVEEEDKVIGRIGIEFDSELSDVAILSFQKGKWEVINGFVPSTKKSEDYVFAQLELDKVEDLLQTLKIIKIAMTDDEE